MSLLIVGLKDRGKNDDEILSAYPDRILSGGEVIDVDSKMAYKKGTGCPGIAWRDKNIHFINGLPKTDGTGEEFINYCKRLEDVYIEECDVERFSRKKPHLPRTFISWPLIDEEQNNCYGVVSADFLEPMHFLSRDEQFLVELGDELEYIAANLGANMPEYSAGRN